MILQKMILNHYNRNITHKYGTPKIIIQFIALEYYLKILTISIEMSMSYFKNYSMANK